MDMTKYNIPLCCNNLQYKLIIKLAKKHGMLNANQLLNKIIELQLK